MSEKPRSVFAGISLTDQTPLARTGPDQRLFAPSTPPPARVPAPEPAAPEAGSTLGRLSEEPPNLSSKVPNNLENKVGRKVDRKISERSSGSASPKPSQTAQRAAPPTATDDEAAAPFDIELRADRQANFVFTEDELDALDDLKRDAKRKFDLRTTKQDLVRYAVIDLLTDYETNGEQSRVIAWLKRRRRGR